MVFVSDRSGEDQLWLGDRSTGSVNQLTRLASLTLDLPSFGADGESIVFVGRGGGRESLYRVSVRSGIVERVSSPDENVRSGAIGPDGSLYLASDRGGSWQLWRRQPGTDQLQRLTSMSAHRPAAPGDGFVYFTRLDHYGLWRVAVTGGEPELVSDAVTFGNHQHWFVHDGALYFPRVKMLDDADGGMLEKVEIVRLPLGDDDQAEVLVVFEDSMAGALGAVAPGGRELLFQRVAEGEEDIAAVTGF